MTASANSRRGLAPHPLVYVAVEVRMPFAPRLAHSEAPQALAELLTDTPVLRQEARARMEPTADGLSLVQEQALRFMDRASTRSIVVTPTSVTFETTRYPGFEVFLEAFIDGLGAVASYASPVGMERIGVRYINEVRPPDSVNLLGEWENWIDPHWISPAISSYIVVRESIPEPEGAALATLGSHFAVGMSGGRMLKVRMEALCATGVIGNEPLKRWEVHPEGNFFVVDLDSFWSSEGGRVEEFDIISVRGLVKSLHDPVKGVFNSIVRKELRELTIKGETKS